ncbi:MAG: polysaccharide biosynthesis protein [Bdellovibrionota bacterium]
MESSFRGRSVLITGGCGAFGQKLVEYLKTAAPSRVTLFSRDEMKHAAFKRTVGTSCPWLNFRIGDICRDEDLAYAMQGVDIVIHAAAMKHLPECEANPRASNLVNVTGTQNVIRAFQSSQADTLIFLSTDKAPYASSIYGAQKYIGEKLVTECSSLGAGKRSFSLRYSNVIDSTGAAFPLFGQLLKAGKKVTVNGSQTVRGFVTQAQVIATINASLNALQGGENIVLIPQVIKIAELAQAMQELIGSGEVEVKEATGFLGEKESATLIMAEERGVAKEFPEAECPALLLDYSAKHPSRRPAKLSVDDSFTLEHCPTLTGSQLRAFLTPVMQANGLLP